MKSEEPLVPVKGRNVYLTVVIQTPLLIALVLLLLHGDWENAFLTFAVIGMTLIPAFLWRRYRIFLPPEFQLSMFLGSARDFYYRFWWWDIVLHMGSGFLLGIVGFIALYLLN